MAFPASSARGKQLFLGTAAAFGAMTMSVNGAAAGTVASGTWSTRGASLVVGAEQSKLELDTGAAVINGPLKIDAAGRFKASGSFEHYLPGPQRADEPSAMHKVLIKGRLTGATITMTMQVAGERGTRKFLLTQGRPAKLIRPL